MVVGEGARQGALPLDPIKGGAFEIQSYMNAWPCLLEIDLDAIAANWRSLQPGPIAAVVKADGYGLGAVQGGPPAIPGGRAPFLRGPPGGGARHPTGRARRDGRRAERLVAGQAPLFTEHDITPVLGSLGEIDAWTTHARTLGRPLPALLHVDTGMNRLGLAAADLAVLETDPHRLDGITPALRHDPSGVRRMSGGRAQ